MIEKEKLHRTRLASLHFDDTNEKLRTIKAYNDLLRSAGHPAAHEGLDQTSPLYAVFLCIVETPVEPEGISK